MFNVPYCGIEINREKSMHGAGKQEQLPSCLRGAIVCKRLTAPQVLLRKIARRFGSLTKRLCSLLLLMSALRSCANDELNVNLAVELLREHDSGQGNSKQKCI